MTTSSRSVLPGIAIEPWTMPMCQVAAGSPVTAAAMSRSGLCGARFVPKTRPWTTTSHGREVDRRVVRVEDRDHAVVGVAPAIAGRSYAR